MRSRRGRFVTVLTNLCALPLAAYGSDVATSGTGGSGDSECASFVPPKTPPWKPVTVRFTNTHKTPYDLVGGGGRSDDAFSITDAKGKSLPDAAGSGPINGPATVSGAELEATALLADGTDTSVDVAC